VERADAHVVGYKDFCLAGVNIVKVSTAYVSPIFHPQKDQD
jgi:hypothetical protein